MRVFSPVSWNRVDAANALHELTSRANKTGSVTLTASAASTTVTPTMTTASSLIFFDPLTANAAAELAAGTMYVATAGRTAGQFVITHANNAQVDRSFRWAAVGD